MKPDCQRCGLCCTAPPGQDVFCNLEPAEVKKLPRKLRLQVWKPTAMDRLAQALSGTDEPLPFAALRTKQISVRDRDGRVGRAHVCAALDGVVGTKVSCSIYEQRPSVCRTAVEPGDTACMEIREANAVVLSGK